MRVHVGWLTVSVSGLSGQNSYIFVRCLVTGVVLLASKNPENG